MGRQGGYLPKQITVTAIATLANGAVVLTLKDGSALRVRRAEGGSFAVHLAESTAGGHPDGPIDRLRLDEIPVGGSTAF